VCVGCDGVDASLGVSLGVSVDVGVGLGIFTGIIAQMATIPSEELEMARIVSLMEIIRFIYWLSSAFEGNYCPEGINYRDMGAIVSNYFPSANNSQSPADISCLQCMKAK